jgi:hypothetical protein
LPPSLAGTLPGTEQTLSKDIVPCMGAAKAVAASDTRNQARKRLV